MRPMDFTCVLRLSKSQLQENVFKDAVIENIHSSLMEYLIVEAHTISFPDLVIPLTIKVILLILCVFYRISCLIEYFFFSVERFH